MSTRAVAQCKYRYFSAVRVSQLSQGKDGLRTIKHLVQAIVNPCPTQYLKSNRIAYRARTVAIEQKHLYTHQQKPHQHHYVCQLHPRNRIIALQQ